VQTYDLGRYASEAGAFTLTGVLAAVLMALTHVVWRESAVPPPHHKDLQVSIELAPAPPKAAPPPVPAPPVHRMIVHRIVPKPALVALPAPTFTETAPPTLDPPPDAAAVAPAASAPPVALPGSAQPDLDAQYAARLREDIDRRTHAPDTVAYRLRRPSGETRLRFVLLRTGEVRSVAIQQTSGSSILDQTALEIVSSGHYPAMPPQAFVGQSEHTFVVTIEFRPLSLAYRGL
jgi:TonB family protein